MVLPYASFAFQVQDNGGTANGGVDFDPSPNTLTFNVIPVNDPPFGLNGTVTMAEDTLYAFNVADFGFIDPADAPPNSLLAVRITTLPAAGTLIVDGAPANFGQVVPVSSIASGQLRFIPGPNASGLPYASFTFQVQDNGGTANGGVDFDLSPNTLTINVTAVNDPPFGLNGAVTMAEDTLYTFNVADFGFIDPNDTPPNSLPAVRITTLPAAGTLIVNGAPVTAGQVVPVSSIASGQLRFTPAANASGLPYASFTFQVQDNGGTANGGVDLDPSPNTLTINVTPVNDAPVGANGTVTTAEDTIYAFTVADFGFIDPNDAPPNSFSGGADHYAARCRAGTLTVGGMPAVCRASRARVQHRQRPAAVHAGHQRQRPALRELHVPGAGQRRHGQRGSRPRPEPQHADDQRHPGQRRAHRPQWHGDHGRGHALRVQRSRLRLQRSHRCAAQQLAGGADHHAARRGDADRRWRTGYFPGNSCPCPASPAARCGSCRPPTPMACPTRASRSRCRTTAARPMEESTSTRAPTR